MQIELKINNRLMQIRNNADKYELAEVLKKLINISIVDKRVEIEIDDAEQFISQHQLSNEKASITIRVYDQQHLLFEEKSNLLNFLAKGKFNKIAIVTDHSSSILKPNVVGEFKAMHSKNLVKKFSIKEVKKEALPLKSLKEFNITVDAAQVEARLKVLVTRDAHQSFIEEKRYSLAYEEGGFVVGHAYLEQERTQCHIIKITDVIDAKHIGASSVELIFTGESFSEINKILRSPKMAGKKILGWYHTHLFPAGDEGFGLSLPDLKLHFTTFRFPWQIAALVNIEHDLTNKLRFYAKKEDQLEMEYFPYWIV
ncbi:MAG: hypothetical protein ACPGJS_00130 [Flammeovirgaceae bacterium]